jgi:hypothetical protein
MNIRTAVGSGVLAIVCAAGSGVAFADKVVEFSINTAPPPPVVVETTPPAPRAGYIYEPGHYTVDKDRYVWSEPRWIREREGHRWTPYKLDRDGDKWHYRSGHWDDD